MEVETEAMDINTTTNKQTPIVVDNMTIHKELSTLLDSHPRIIPDRFLDMCWAATVAHWDAPVQPRDDHTTSLNGTPMSGALALENITLSPYTREHLGALVSARNTDCMKKSQKRMYIAIAHILAALYQFSSVAMGLVAAQEMYARHVLNQPTFVNINMRDPETGERISNTEFVQGMYLAFVDTLLARADILASMSLYYEALRVPQKLVEVDLKEHARTFVQQRIVYPLVLYLPYNNSDFFAPPRDYSRQFSTYLYNNYFSFMQYTAQTLSPLIGEEGNKKRKRPCVKA